MLTTYLKITLQFQCAYAFPMFHVVFMLISISFSFLPLTTILVCSLVSSLFSSHLSFSGLTFLLLHNRKRQGKTVAYIFSLFNPCLIVFFNFFDQFYRSMRARKIIFFLGSIIPYLFNMFRFSIHSASLISKALCQTYAIFLIILCLNSSLNPFLIFRPASK